MNNWRGKWEKVYFSTQSLNIIVAECVSPRIENESAKFNLLANLITNSSVESQNPSRNRQNASHASRYRDSVDRLLLSLSFLKNEASLWLQVWASDTHKAIQYHRETLPFTKSLQWRRWCGDDNGWQLFKKV